MKRPALRGTVALLVSLLFTPDLTLAEPSVSPPVTFASEEYRWAQGRTIDSISVVGNQKVKDIAILREMELRAGMPFDLASFERDQRYIGDLGVFSSVVITVDPLGDDMCSMRITVTERPTILLKLIYPILEYDFNSERIRYGVKWNDRNFRKRLETFSVDVQRDNFNNDRAAIQWSTRWMGWKQIGTFARASYFYREDPPGGLQIVEQGRVRVAAALPLSDSRIQVTQVLGGIGFADNRLGQPDGEGGTSFEDETLFSPNLGFSFDRRDSPLKPNWGDSFFLNLTGNRVLNGPDRNYFVLSNDIRSFRPINDYTVIGFHSRLDYQFGEFPKYIGFNVGGAGSIRGYEPSDFRGNHRTYQNLELRISPWAKRFYRLPIAGLSDFLVSMVLFVDGGIAWRNENDFNGDNYHVGFGWGLRLYSPFEDVIRFDMGYDRYGRVRPYITTGVMF